MPVLLRYPGTKGMPSRNIRDACAEIPDRPPGYPGVFRHRRDVDFSETAEAFTRVNRQNDGFGPSPTYHPLGHAGQGSGDHGGCAGQDVGLPASRISDDKAWRSFLWKDEPIPTLEVVMPRELSSDTRLAYSWLWRLPWASARDIAGVTGMSTRSVSNALKRGRDRGWFESARLGRVFEAVNRFVLSNEGVRELHDRYGWMVFWWHTAQGARDLTRRLEVVEMAYAYLPDLWRSNAVSKPHVWVIPDMPSTNRAGEPATSRKLVELNWQRAYLYDFHWLKTLPFEAIATYANGSRAEDLLHLPLLWRGDFQKADHIAWVTEDMARVLIEDERRPSLPENQAVSGPYYPGMIIFCPDRVSAAMVQRHWLESLTSRERIALPAIVDAQGQVVRAMDPPTAWWESFQLPPRAALPTETSRPVRAPGSPAYNAVNRKGPWDTFRTVDSSPGMTLEQIADRVGVRTGAAEDLLGPMVQASVLTCRAGGYYVYDKGRVLLAGSQRRSQSRVNRRSGVYARAGGESDRNM